MSNILSTLIQIGGLALQFIPPPKPPQTDYKALHEALDAYDRVLPNFSTAISTDRVFPDASTAISTPGALAVIEPESQPDYGPNGREVSTSCINCSRSHLITAAGALDEALRFAREGGIMHPEAVKRISLAEREINIMERVDLSPESILKSPQQDQDMARELVPKVRVLRQNIGMIASPLQLEQVAAQANELATQFQKVHMASRVEVIDVPAGYSEEEEVEEVEAVPDNAEVERMEARLKDLQSQGYNLNPIIELARAVENGTLTKEQAKLEVRKLLYQRRSDDSIENVS
ncbi:MAG: hypothetical protein PHU23_11730 [Dehalococcoidales bacterium]|nr:hypothetical protein [Dehalococcoidales bacterium]